MVVNLSDNNFEEEVLNFDGKVLIDMFAQWCEPCQVMSPLVDELAEENLPNVKVCKVDIDENMELATKFNVVSIPTFLIIKNGEVEKMFVGITDIDEIKKALLA